VVSVQKPPSGVKPFGLLYASLSAKLFNDATQEAKIYLLCVLSAFAVRKSLPPAERNFIL